MDKRIQSAIEMIDFIVNDVGVPKNIKKALNEAKERLLNENEELKVRVGSAIYLIDSVASDVNLRNEHREIIWRILSLLEGIK